MRRKWFSASLVLGAMLLSGATAKADFTVSFITTGIFTGGDLAGSNEYLDAANGVDILFNSSLNNTVTVPPATNVSFGTFSTLATTAVTPIPVLSNFILIVTETSGPNPGASLSFNGSFNGGSLDQTNSSLSLLFAGPLIQNIGPISFRIASGDGGTPGNVFIAPPQTDNGTTSIAGIVNAVPEPSSFALMGMGATAGLALLLRRRLRVAEPVSA